MGIRFIFGRAGTGKSRFCLDQIRKKIDNGKDNKLILMVPEQYTFDTERNFLKVVTERGLLRGQVLSFKTMAQRVFEECGGRSEVRMSDLGKNMLIHKLLKDNIENLKYFNRISKQQGFTSIVSKMITEFKKYNISSQLLENKEDDIEDEELKKKMNDLKLIFDSFNDSIENRFKDNDDDLTFLAEKLENCKMYDDAEIWIDEFTVFTPQQLNVIAVLAKKAKVVNITLCSDMKVFDKKTDIFDAIRNTENSILNLMKEKNISYVEPIDLNKGYSHRFVNSDDLKHIEENFFNYSIKKYEGKANNVRVYKANNTYHEVEVIAKDILKMVRDRGYRFKDIAVVCRDMESYEKIVSVIFDEYNIPFFLDKKREILNNPLIVLIISSLEIISSNWSYESVFKYLKSSLINIDREDIDTLENYILANGIKGRKWTCDLREDKELTDEENAIIDIMESVREPILNLYENIKKKVTIREFTIKLYEFLTKLDVFNTLDIWLEKFASLGMQDKVKEYTQVPKIVVEILEQLVDVLGEEKVDIKEYTKILISGFEEKEIGVIPMALDQVNIGDIARIKGREVKNLYLMGVNDGVLPSANKEEGIISNRERDILRDIGISLASDTKSRVFEEQYMVYTALTIPSERLMITYPMADFEGKSLRPSIIIPRIKKVLPNIIEESEIFNKSEKEDKFSKITAPTPTFNELIGALRMEAEKEEIDSYWAEVFKWFEKNDEFKNKSKRIFNGLTYTNLVENVPREKIRRLYESESKKLMFSVSRVENYARCPFSYYVKYGLKAKDRKVYEFSAPDLGTFMHTILDEFTSKVKDEKIAWSQLDRERCKSIVNELVDRKLEMETNSILNSTKKYKYFADRFKKTITKSVTVISEQMRRGSFEVFKNEFSFGGFKQGEQIKLDLPSKETVYLVGRVDRIDTLDLDGNTYIKIVDYKSGSKKFNLNEVYHGLQVQLLVYLDAIIKNSEQILKKQSVPGAILYFRIDDPIIKSKKKLSEEEIKENILKELKMSGLLLKDIQVVKSMDSDMETYSLIIPAAIKKDGNFTSSSSVITEDQFGLLRKYVNKKMVDICEEMLSGQINIEPCKDSNNAYCAYCDYTSICQFDTSIENNKYKTIFNKKSDDIWNLIKEEIGEEDTNEHKVD